MAEGNEIVGRQGTGVERAEAELSLTEAKARLVLGLATRSLLWVVLVGLVLYYSIKGDNMMHQVGARG